MRWVYVLSLFVPPPQYYYKYNSITSAIPLCTDVYALPISTLLNVVLNATLTQKPLPAHSLNALMASSIAVNVSNSVPLMNNWCTIYIFIPLGTLLCYLNATRQGHHHRVLTHDNGARHRFPNIRTHPHQRKVFLYVQSYPPCYKGFHSWSASTSHVCFFVTLATCISCRVSWLSHSRCCRKQSAKNGQ